jgi:excisionase family DNA binding protein
LTLNGNIVDIKPYLARPALVDELSREELAALLEQLKALEGKVMARLLLGASRSQTIAEASNQGQEKMLTAKQLAEHLEVKESWVMSEARANRIPKRMVGRYVRFDLADVRRALEQRQV